MLLIDIISIVMLQLPSLSRSCCFNPRPSGRGLKQEQTRALAQLIFCKTALQLMLVGLKPLRNLNYYPQAKACGNSIQIQNFN